MSVNRRVATRAAATGARYPKCSTDVSLGAWELGGGVFSGVGRGCGRSKWRPQGGAGPSHRGRVTGRPALAQAVKYQPRQWKRYHGVCSCALPPPDSNQKMNL
jgi:hypothetical protein